MELLTRESLINKNGDVVIPVLGKKHDIRKVKMAIEEVLTDTEKPRGFSNQDKLDQCRQRMITNLDRIITRMTTHSGPYLKGEFKLDHMLSTMRGPLNRRCEVSVPPGTERPRTYTEYSNAYSLVITRIYNMIETLEANTSPARGKRDILPRRR